MTNCRLAALTAPDREAIVEHLCRLSVDDRVLRFSTAVANEGIVEYCRRWNFDRDIVEGAVIDGRIVGVLHLPVYDERSVVVGEIGVSVDADARRRHLATRLTVRALERARNRGLARVYIHFLCRNRPMMNLAGRFTSDINFEQDEATATIPLAGVVAARAAEAASPAAESLPAAELPQDVERPSAAVAAKVETPREAATVVKSETSREAAVAA